MTKIIKCKCKNSGQDSIHGVGLRVHNVLWNKSGRPAIFTATNGKPCNHYRCTVCTDIKEG